MNHSAVSQIPRLESLEEISLWIKDHVTSENALMPQLMDMSVNPDSSSKS